MSHGANSQTYSNKDVQEEEWDHVRGLKKGLDISRFHIYKQHEGVKYKNVKMHFREGVKIYVKEYKWRCPKDISVVLGLRCKTVKVWLLQVISEIKIQWIFLNNWRYFYIKYTHIC